MNFLGELDWSGGQERQEFIANLKELLYESDPENSEIERLNLDKALILLEVLESSERIGVTREDCGVQRFAKEKGERDLTECSPVFFCGIIFDYCKSEGVNLPQRIFLSKEKLVSDCVTRNRERVSTSLELLKIISKTGEPYEIIGNKGTAEKSKVNYIGFYLPRVRKLILVNNEACNGTFVLHLPDNLNPEDLLGKTKRDLSLLQLREITTVVRLNLNLEDLEKKIKSELDRSNPDDIEDLDVVVLEEERKVIKIDQGSLFSIHEIMIQGRANLQRVWRVIETLAQENQLSLSRSADNSVWCLGENSLNKIHLYLKPSFVNLVLAYLEIENQEKTLGVYEIEKLIQSLGLLFNRNRDQKRLEELEAEAGLASIYSSRMNWRGGRRRQYRMEEVEKLVIEKRDQERFLTKQGILKLFKSRGMKIGSHKLNVAISREREKFISERPEWFIKVGEREKLHPFFIEYIYNLLKKN